MSSWRCSAAVATYLPEITMHRTANAHAITAALSLKAIQHDCLFVCLLGV